MAYLQLQRGYSEDSEARVLSMLAVENDSPLAYLDGTDLESQCDIKPDLGEEVQAEGLLQKPKYRLEQGIKVVSTGSPFKLAFKSLFSSC